MARNRRKNRRKNRNRKRSHKLRFQLTPLQFSDPKKQQKFDVEKIFRKGKRWPIKTFTESGNYKNHYNFDLLNKAAEEHNHVIAFAGDNAIAVDMKIVRPGSVKIGKVHVMDKDDFEGTGGDRAFPTLEFTHKKKGVGRIAVAQGHLARYGRQPDDVNFHASKVYSEKLRDWAKVAGRGSALAFVLADFNRPDGPRKDFLVGKTGLTSAFDRVKRWINTGHGPIDGLMTLDKDGRVSVKKVMVKNDKSFFLFTDHFVTRTVIDIELLRKN